MRPKVRGLVRPRHRLITGIVQQTEPLGGQEALGGLVAEMALEAGQQGEAALGDKLAGAVVIWKGRLVVRLLVGGVGEGGYCGL